MKKYILGTLFVLGIFISPVFASPVEASALTAYQITSIISLLQAFGADQSVINNVQTALGGGGGGAYSQTSGFYAFGGPGGNGGGGGGSLIADSGYTKTNSGKGGDGAVVLYWTEGY